MTKVWEAAEDAAMKLYENHQTSGGLADLDAICATLDIRVFYTKRLPGGTSGLIVKRDKWSPAHVYVNATESRQRQRFTLAHEIGHYMERSTIVDDNSFSFRDGRGGPYDLHEFYADQFAGALLMPASQVLKRNPNLQNDPLSLGMAAIDVAKQFDVSHAAAKKRLERLSKQGSIK